MSDMENRLQMICTQCFRMVKNNRKCNCGSDFLPLGNSVNDNIVFGVIKMIPDIYDPYRVLYHVCNGLGRFPDPFDTDCWLAERRHHGKSVWMWSSLYGDMPLLSNPDENDGNKKNYSSYYALTSTDALFIHLPSDNSSFRAKFRRYYPGGAIPSFSELSGNIEDILNYLGVNLKTVAVIDAGLSKEQFFNLKARIKKWPGIPKFLFYQDVISAVKTTLQREEIVKKWKKVPPIAPAKIIADLVPIFDIGGHLGRDFLTMLHLFMATITDIGNKPLGSCILTNVIDTSETRHFRKIRRIFDVDYLSPKPIPAWMGQFQKLSWYDRYFPKKKYESDPQAPQYTISFKIADSLLAVRHSVIIAAIGPDDFKGESGLKKLIEWSWRTKPHKIVFLTNSQSNPRLTAWIKDEFYRPDIHYLPHEKTYSPEIVKNYCRSVLSSIFSGAMPAQRNSSDKANRDK